MRRRFEASLKTSLAINLLYCGYKMSIALFLHSAWAGASAFYYLILSAARFYLLRSLRGRQLSRSRMLRKYHLCGWMLLALTIPVGVIGGHSILRGEFASYPGHMIYAAATYTFYTLYASIANLLQQGKRNLLHSAGRLLSFANALTAIFSLQCAMIAQFGGNPSFQSTMNTITGLGVFISIAAMASCMILKR